MTDLRDAEIADLKDQNRIWREHAGRMRDQVVERIREVYRLQTTTVPLEDVRRLWQNWKDAWGTGDSEEALALMEMDLLLGVDERGNVLA